MFRKFPSNLTPLGYGNEIVAPALPHRSAIFDEPNRFRMSAGHSPYELAMMFGVARNAGRHGRFIALLSSGMTAGSARA
jgi:hypothetical protein